MDKRKTETIITEHLKNITENTVSQNMQQQSERNVRP